MDQPLRDQKALVTGASSGIGEGIARALAAAGAAVIVNYASSPDGAARVVNAITSAGGEARAIKADVAKEPEVEAMFAEMLGAWGRLDVLVSNAGVATVAPIEDLSDQDVDDMIDVNLKGVVYGITAALPVFRAQGGGHFVQTVSTSGLRIVPQQTIYAGVKNAVRTISEGLRQEVGDTIRVTAVSPGMTRTEFAPPATDDPEQVAARERMAKIAIAPEAIARAIAFAIEQPGDVDVNEIVVRPSAQG